MAGVVTLGETMALLSVPASGLIRQPVPVGMGGAESNVAIGLARLGVPATWMSRLGDDALGTYVLREIRAEGVTVRAQRDPDAPTGLMLKELRDDRPTRVRYYRAGSAASRMTPADVDDTAVADADILHLTGITPALGAGPLAAMEHAITVAQGAGTLVSLDVNHRRTLWSDEQARETLTKLLAGVDLVFAGTEEAEMVLGLSAEAPDLAAALAALGPATAVLKLGADGALAHHDGAVTRASSRPRTVVDPVGAGDAFVAGYLAELVARNDVGTCLATGNKCGGAVVTVRGDWEGLPTVATILQDNNNDEVIR